MMKDIYAYFEESISDIKADIPQDWDCTNYHNDTCASFQFNGWHIWISHHKKAKRDMMIADMSRFNVCPINEHGEFIQNAESFDFDCFNEVLAHVAQKHNF